MTLRRRREDGSLEQLVFNCMVVATELIRGEEVATLTDEEVVFLVLDTEIQTNGEVYESPRPSVRMWFNER
jgi:hypothetical protein